MTFNSEKPLATLKAGLTERRNQGIVTKRRNGENSPEILKDGMTENLPKSLKPELEGLQMLWMSAKHSSQTQKGEAEVVPPPP